MDAASLGNQRWPSPHQRLMQQIELIKTRARVFQPVPLHDRGFKQRCWGIRVVFQQFRRSGPVVGEVHAPIERLLARAPGTLCQRRRNRPEAQPRVVARAHDIGHCIQAHRVQFVACRFEPVDLDLVEPEARVLHPVRTIERMKLEAERLDALAPVTTDRNRATLHQEPAARTRPLPPNPPR